MESDISHLIILTEIFLRLMLQLRRKKSTVRKGEIVERHAFLGPPGVFSCEPAGAADTSGSSTKWRGCLQMQGRFPKLADEKLES